MSRLLGIAALALSFAGSAAAQSQSRVIPAALVTEPGNARIAAFASFHSGRVQQLVLAPRISSKPATLRELQVRPSTWSFFENAVLITTMNVSLGHSTRTPATMTKTFAANRSTAMTTVFSGAFTLPATTVVLPPTRVFPFVLAWKFSRPFTFDPAIGNLLIEWDVPGPPTQPGTAYRLAAHTPTASSGTFAISRAGGPFFQRESARPSGDVQALTAGGRVVLRAAPFSRPYPALAIFGFSTTRWGTLPLPLDLAPFGAPLNWLHCSIDLITSPVWQKPSSGWQVETQLPIPNTHAFDGLRIYGQFVFADPLANPLGLVFHYGNDMQISQTEPFSSLVEDVSNTTLSGTLHANTGLVLRLVGTFP